MQKEDLQKITGLTLEEVAAKKKLGMTNEIIDTYTPSRLVIFRRNIFNLVNIVLFPLLATLAIYGLFVEVFAFTTFLLINTIVSIFDELRIKKQLEKLKNQFNKKVTVIRDSKEFYIPVTEVVEGDFIKASSGESIIADGEIIKEDYLQIDESALNGESNYIRKEKSEKIYSGSFIVTGSCIYKVTSVGKNNYLNKLGSEALKFKEKKSQMQRNFDKLIFILVFVAIALSAFNFLMSSFGSEKIEGRILAVTSIISLIIPQTLIFLGTLTFTISITKLFNKGVLVQKGGSIEDLVNVDVICFDKTGTITTNDMSLKQIEYFNTNEAEVGAFYNSIQERLVSVNKTQEILNKYYLSSNKLVYSDFDQVPFTSKNKYSLVSAKFNNEFKTLVLGAFSMLKNNIDDSVLNNVLNYVNKQEESGNRVLVGIFYNSESKFIDTNSKDFDFNKSISEISLAKSRSIIVFTIEETLNPGIKEIIEDLEAQSIKVKIISGDSKQSVERIIQKLGLDTSKIIDLSTNTMDLKDVVNQFSIFTRAKPEDKLTIVKLLQQTGHKVAMVGDGINDVLSLKASDVSIAMEGGSKIAREVADIVLLNNDYKKIPTIFFEGDNIIFNLKTTTKMFLLKSFFAGIIAVIFSLALQRFPIDPASTLIFSFLGSSAPSYILVFTRQKVNNSVGFFKEVLFSTIPIATLIAIIFTALYLYLKNIGLSFVQLNTFAVVLILTLSIIYSFFLFWEAKKLKSIFLTIFFYALLIGLGVMQTILPLELFSRSMQDGIVLICIMLVGFIIFNYILFKSIKPKRLVIKLAIPISIGLFLLAACFFPFRTYYNVTSLDFSTHLIIQLTAAVFVPLLFISNFITVKLTNLKNKI